MFFISCSNLPGDTADQNHSRASAGSILNSSCAYLTKDNNANPVMSWVKEINDSVAVMCYSVSSDNGKRFGNVIEVKPSTNVHPHAENLPKIIFKPSGEIIAMWGASNPTPNSKYSGLVYYAQSFDNGKNWSEAIALVKDTSAYDQRYFDMELLPNGEVMAIWLDNRGPKEREGSTLFCAVTEGNNGFINERAIGETCCPCCRTDLFIDRNGGIHASYRDIINDSIRDMVQLVSNDGGKTFVPPVRISEDNWVINGCPHTGPTQAENSNGMHFAWYTMGGGEGVYYCSSKDLGKTFSGRDTVSNKPSAKHPQIITMPDDIIVIVWDETVKKGEEAFSRIGLQLRDPNGKVISSTFISEDNAVSEYAVVRAVDEKNVLVAFTQKQEKKKKVIYKIIPLTGGAL